ncbi:MAG TPA: hypothetical protein PLY16_03400, partial [Candidatus Saccharibacteria bacterium]|nr:hypothetical protein [Candidatus Saccharibacteria bacterium]
FAPRRFSCTTVPPTPARAPTTVAIIANSISVSFLDVTWSSVHLDERISTGRTEHSKNIYNQSYEKYQTDFIVARFSANRQAYCRPMTATVFFRTILQR